MKQKKKKKIHKRVQKKILKNRVKVPKNSSYLTNDDVT